MKLTARLLALALSVTMLFASATEAVTVTFRQNVAGYTQAQDTWLPKQLPNTNFAANPAFGIGQQGMPNEEHSLVGFYGIFGNGIGQIPVGATINSATLFLGSSSVTVPPNGAVHQMLIPWTDTVVTWNNLTGGLNNLPSAEYDPLPAYSGSLASGPVPVTSIVQSWSNGSPNYGFALLPTSTGGVGAQSSEAGNFFARPMLTVDYAAVPEPTTAMLAAGAAATLVGMRRRFRFESSRTT